VNAVKRSIPKNTVAWANLTENRYKERPIEPSRRPFPGAGAFQTLNFMLVDVTIRGFSDSR